MKSLIFALLVNIVYATPTHNDKPLLRRNSPSGYVDKPLERGFIGMLSVTKKRVQPSIGNPNRICEICSAPYVAKSASQKMCSNVCRKIRWESANKTFRGRHPAAMKTYNKTRKEKNPTVWKDKVRKERLEILAALGGKCVVCSATNTNWLHVDYIPTMGGTGLRHPRHKKWVFDHLKDFRILCANHHYELTISGKIEGTTITQKTRKQI